MKKSFGIYIRQEVYDIFHKYIQQEALKKGDLIERLIVQYLKSKGILVLEISNPPIRQHPTPRNPSKIKQEGLGRAISKIVGNSVSQQKSNEISTGNERVGE